jgi:hypothetical protein
MEIIFNEAQAHASLKDLCFRLAVILGKIRCSISEVEMLA